MFKYFIFLSITISYPLQTRQSKELEDRLTWTSRKEPRYSELPAYDCELTGPLTEDPKKPTILVVGDSISLMYTPFLRVGLAVKYNVIHNKCNAGHAGHAAYKINSYLNGHRYAAIIFNVGIWDLNVPSISVGAYHRYLTMIARAIKNATPRPIFLMMTSHPDELYRMNMLRHAAADVMTTEKIQILDIYEFSQGLEHLKDAGRVHYVPAGSEALAGWIIANANLN